MNGIGFPDIPTPEDRRGDDRRKNPPSFKVTFGEGLILLSVIFGLIFQYLNFSVRMGEFEGYTRAKIESIDIELKRINSFVDFRINQTKQNK